MITIINKIVDENYFDLIIDNSIIDFYGSRDNITPLNETQSMLHVLNKEMDMCILGTYPYQFFPSIFTLTSDISFEKSGISQVRRNTNLGLYGQGVLVGIIDTGIEYQHQAFLYNDNTSRIVSIWDQTINTDNTPPEGFLYGMEYDRNTINFALKSDNPLDIVPSNDQIGHGTMLAGIIAGNVNIDQEFSGVVPEAEFVIVKLKLAKIKNRKIFAISDDVICYQESDIIAGINYVSTVANRLERPISICLASGTSQGEHYGVGATSNYVSFVSQIPRRAITIAAGNEGNKHRHYLGEINTEIASYNEFELKISVKDKTFSMEIWQHAPYRLSIGIMSPTGESFADVYPKLNKCLKHNFIFEPSVVWINNYISETETGEQLILIRFENAKEGIWNFKVHNLDNKASIFNVWLPSGEIISDETYFLDSNPNTTVMSPGNAIFPLTVTAYNQISGSILNNSSRGFTTSNVVKPDIAAPGYELICPLLNNTYGTATGTGAAAAHVTGIVAMVLEWGIVKGNYTIISGAEINKLLIRGAERDSDIEYPNEIWGYGKIDIWGFFIKLIIT